MTAYEKGACFERKIKKFLQKKGWFVSRSAGSKGLVDLTACRRVPLGSPPVVFFIQAKLGAVTYPELERLTFLAEEYGAIPILARRRVRVAYIQFVDLRTMKELNL